MTFRIEVEKIRNMLIFFLLFFASMNFQAKFFFFVFGATGVLLLLRRFFVVDYGAFVYLALGIWMAIYNYDEGLLSMVRCIAPTCFYLVGLNLTLEDNRSIGVEQDLNYFQKQGKNILLAISLGSFFHYMMNYIYNFGQNLGRNTNDIWTGVSMAATGQNALACLMLGFAVALLFLPGKEWHRVLAALSVIAILMYNLVLAGRTVIIILACLLIVGFFYKKINKMPNKKSDTIYLAVISILVLVLFIFNIGGIRDYVFKSELLSRFNISLSSLTDDNARVGKKLNFISHAIFYPFGGLHLREKYGFAHDLLLDGYDEYGFVALVLMIIMLSMGIINIYKNLRYTSYSHSFKLMLLLINISILLEFMVEPILEGMPWLFSCYSLINGCVSGLNRTYFSKRSLNNPDESIANQYGLRRR